MRADSRPVAQARLDRAIGRYVAEVHREFRALRNGHPDPRAEGELADIFHALESYTPRTFTQEQFYVSATEQVHTIVGERESRIDAAETEHSQTTAGADAPTSHPHASDLAVH